MDQGSVGNGFHHRGAWGIISILPHTHQTDGCERNALFTPHVFCQQLFHHEPHIPRSIGIPVFMTSPQDYIAEIQDFQSFPNGPRTSNKKKFVRIVRKLIMSWPGLTT